MSDDPVVEPLAVQSIYIQTTAGATPHWSGTINTSVGTNAATAYGWQVGKTATSTPYMRGFIGATATSTAAVASSPLAAAAAPVLGTGSGATTASDFFSSATAFTLAFPAGNWTFNFNLRTTVASTQAGRIRFRLWAASNRNGSNARELTSGPQAASIVTLSALSTTYNSTLVWAAPAINLANEFLLIQVEWQITTAGGSNTANVVFWSISTSAAITTTNAATLVFGTADIDPTASVIAGLGVSSSVGTGDVDPTAAVVNGLGDTGSVGTGVLVAGVSALTGIAETATPITSTGVLVAGSSILSGSGTVATIATITGSGALGITLGDTFSTSFTPGVDRDDFTGDIGVRLRFATNATFTWLGLRCAAGNTGLHKVTFSDWFDNTIYATAIIDLTGKVEGEYVWVRVEPFSVVALTGYYALAREVVSGSGQVWANNGPTTFSSPVDNVYACYRSPAGSWQPGPADMQYVGLDLGQDSQAPWLPIDLGSSLTGWFDVADASTVTVTGSGVSQLRDKSSYNSNATQSNDALRPAYAPGKISFTGGQQHLTISRTGTYDFVMAMRPHGGELAGSYWRVVLYGTTSGMGLVINDAGTVGTYNYSGFQAAGGLTWTANTDGLVYGQITNAGAASLSRDGGSQVSTGSPVQDVQLQSISRSDYTQSFGDLYELIFVLYGQTLAVKQKLEGYIAHKWNIDSLLPVDHPYKSAAPTIPTAGSLVAGTGSVLSLSTGSGILVATPAILTGIGTTASRSTAGTVTAGSSSLTGVGVSASRGTSVITSGTAVIAGAGLSASTGVSVLVSSASIVIGTAAVGSFATSTGVVVASASSLTGSGTVANTVYSGSGVLGANTPLPNFLLHGESFTDSAGGHTVTAGGTTISATQQKFGTSSISISGSSAVHLDAATDLSIGSADDFTIDFWVYPTNTSSVHPMCAWYNGATDNLDICIRGSGCLQVFDHGGLVIVGGTAFTLNGWNHVALTRSGGSLRGFLNGVLQGTNNSNVNTFPVSGQSPKFGQGIVGGTQQFNGYIDEIRFIKGVAVWTANFAPPSSVYSLGSPAVVVGTATSAWVSTGVLQAGSSALTGTATAVTVYTSTGILQAGSSTLAGNGTSASRGSSVIAAGSANITGTGVSVSVGTGVLNSGICGVSGSGTVASRGTGVLAAGVSLLTGAAAAGVAGIGILVDTAATVTGVGTSAARGIGVIEDGASSVIGVGQSGSVSHGVIDARASALTATATAQTIGTGHLQPDAGALTGDAEAISTAHGDLQASEASLYAEAQAGAAIAIGQLIVASAVLIGDGDTAPALDADFPRTIIVPDDARVVAITSSSRVVAVGSSTRTLTPTSKGRTIVVSNGSNRRLVA